VGFDGEPALIAYAWIDKHQLCLLAQWPEAQALSAAAAFSGRLLFGALIILGVALALGVYLARSIAKPVRETSEYLRRFYPSVDGEPLQPTGALEVRQLGESINVTAEGLRARHQAAERRFASALESMPEGFALFDSADRLEVYNQAWLTDFNGPLASQIASGMARADIIKLNFEADRLTDPIAGAEDSIHTQLLGQDRLGHSKPFRLDSNRWIESVSHPVDGGGTIRVLSDITKAKLAEDELRQYAHIVSSVSDLLVFTDASGVIRSANERFLQYHNLELNEVIGRKIALVLGIDQFERITNGRLANVLKGHLVGVAEWIEYPLRGRRWMTVECSPFYGPDETVVGVVTAARDETERRIADDERITLEAQLRQAQKMETIGHLTGGIAHDFNNIPATLLGLRAPHKDSCGARPLGTTATLHGRD
jgi:PAS domain S-box-containing protein